MIPGVSSHPSHRTALHAQHGVVATSHPLAAQAGLQVLRDGGTAVDAAIATAATLTVVEPTSNGLGGDAFALIWDGEQLHGLNGSGRAPAALTVDAVRAAGHDTMPWHGWLSVSVPGQVDAWKRAHERYGSVAWDRLFVDAIAYAEHGAPVPPTVAHYWARTAEIAAERWTGPEFAGWAQTFAPAPAAGDVRRLPGHARTLRSVAEHGAATYHTGEVAAAILDWSERTGGLLTAADLAEHEGEWVEPITLSYRGHDVAEIPPNGQGLATLLALGVLEGFDPGEPEDPAWLHLQIEAMKLAFADAFAFIGDPSRVEVPTAGMLDRDYLVGRRALLGDTAGDFGPGEPARGGTVLLTTADAEGRMVSFIQSNYAGFGSGVVVPEWGLALQNRAGGFVLDEGHPNRLEPGRRPFHTIIPGFLMREGLPVGPFGVMGGHMQAQGHLQVVVRTLDHGQDPQTALDAPRWRVEGFGSEVVVHVEDTMPEASVEGLRARGHEVVVEGQGGFGRGQAIWRTPAGGYVAGTESRCDGAAVGW